MRILPGSLDESINNSKNSNAPPESARINRFKPNPVNHNVLTTENDEDENNNLIVKGNGNGNYLSMKTKTHSMSLVP